MVKQIDLDKEHLSDADVQAIVDAWTPEQQAEAAFEIRSQYAGSNFSVEGFKDFYFCLFKREVPPYVRDVWADRLVKAFQEGKGVLLEAFRGSTKSTTLLAWALFITGHYAHRSTVLVRINDTAAAETGKAMATIIEIHPGWRACFPKITPDKDKGWSASGYFVKDTSVPYGEWAAKCISDHLADPNILVAGVTSGDIIGKHPTNGMYFDDLHNTRNTRSDREKLEIVEILKSDIIPTWTTPDGHPTLVVACTLWDEKDAYHAMLATGLFEHVRTPIYRPDDDGKYNLNGMPVSLAWPEKFGIKRILKLMSENPVQFPRMYACDLSGMKGKVLKRDWLHEYPKDKINPKWTICLGVDFASTEDKLKDRDIDYFSIAVVALIPDGGMVLLGGVREKLSSGEARAKLIEWAGLYPTLRMVGIEKWGKGEEFKTRMLYSTALPITPLPFEGSPVKSKGERFQGQGGLASLFTTNRAWISDVHDDFLLAFIDEWISWDGGRTASGHDDTLDAAYWAFMVSNPHLMGESGNEMAGMGHVEEYTSRWTEPAAL